MTFIGNNVCVPYYKIRIVLICLTSNAVKCSCDRVPVSEHPIMEHNGKGSKKSGKQEEKNCTSSRWPLEALSRRERGGLLSWALSAAGMKRLKKKQTHSHSVIYPPYNGHPAAAISGRLLQMEAINHHVIVSGFSLQSSKCPKWTWKGNPHATTDYHWLHCGHSVQHWVELYHFK